MITGFSDGLARIDGRIAGLENEADPLSALELLTDWERVAGLPDQCLPTTGSVRERQLRVARKIAGIGGQSRSYFIEQAALLGLTIEIEEFHPAQIGCRCDERLQNDDWRFVWMIRVVPVSQEEDLVRLSWARIGSRCDERLRSFSITELECITRRAAPAHTTVLFSYPVDPEPLLWFDFILQGEY